MIRALTLLATLGVAACQPQARSRAYFDANPRAAARVVADCRTNGETGRECPAAEAADAADAAAKAKAREALFRQGFK
jgi:hypothetical protein